MVFCFHPMTSYEILKGEDKNTFSYASMHEVEYTDLKNQKSSHLLFIVKRMVFGKVEVQVSFHL